MKRTKILEYLNDLRENYPNSPLIPQVVGDELTFALKKEYKGIPIKDIIGSDFEMLENIIVALDTLSPDNETILTPYEIMDELEPYTSEYLEVWVTDKLEVKINAPLGSRFNGYLDTEIEIPNKVTKNTVIKEIVPKIKKLSETAEKVAKILLEK
jgi:hypothetical protein